MRPHVVLVVLMLLMATLACSLTRDGNDDESSTQVTPTATPRLPSSQQTLIGPQGTEEVGDDNGDDSDDNGDEADSDVVKPDVRFVDPLPPNEITIGDEITLKAEASHDEGITEIRFLYVFDGNEERIARVPIPSGDTTVEREVPWTPETPGTYEVQVVAYQGSDNLSDPATQTLQVLAEPTLEPTLEPTEIPPCIGTVKETVRRRTGPGTSFPSRGNYGPNTQLEAILYDTDDTGQGWFKVIGPDEREYWVIGTPQYIDWQGGCLEVPRVAP